MGSTDGTGRPRFHWVDVMKVMGMYFIIYGHFFSYGYEYVYTFSVPVFFIISGFLFKENEPGHVFWGKLWRQLVLPMLVICLVFNLYHLLFHGDTAHLLFPLWVLAGEHRFLDVCWFIYNLVLLKVISQYVYNNVLRTLLAAVFLVAAYFVAPVAHAHDWRNAALDVLLTYPFFVAGHLVRKGGFVQQPIPWWVCLPGAVLSAAAVYFVTRANGVVYVFSFHYGNYLGLYLIGGFAGTCLLYFVSKLFDRPVGWVRTLSEGMVVILGFHYYFIYLYHMFFGQSPFDVVAAGIILLLFVPIIKFCIRYVPWLVGGRKI